MGPARIVIAPHSSRNSSSPMVVEYDIHTLNHLITKYGLTMDEWSVLNIRNEEVFLTESPLRIPSDRAVSETKTRDYDGEYSKFMQFRNSVVTEALYKELIKVGGSITKLAKVFEVERKTLYRYLSIKLIRKARREHNGYSNAEILI